MLDYLSRKYDIVLVVGDREAVIGFGDIGSNSLIRTGNVHRIPLCGCSTHNPLIGRGGLIRPDLEDWHPCVKKGRAYFSKIITLLRCTLFSHFRAERASNDSTGFHALLSRNRSVNATSII